MKRFRLIMLIACFGLSANAQNIVGAKEIPSIEQNKPDRNMLGRTVYKIFIKDNQEVNRIEYEALIHIGFNNSEISKIRVIEKTKNVTWELYVNNIEETDLGLKMKCENTNKDTFTVMMRPIDSYSNIWEQAGGDIVFIQIKSDILNIGYIMVEADKDFLESFIGKK